MEKLGYLITKKNPVSIHETTFTCWGVFLTKNFNYKRDLSQQNATLSWWHGKDLGWKENLVQSSLVFFCILPSLSCYDSSRPMSYIFIPVCLSDCNFITHKSCVFLVSRAEIYFLEIKYDIFSTRDDKTWWK